MEFLEIKNKLWKPLIQKSFVQKDPILLKKVINLLLTKRFFLAKFFTAISKFSLEEIVYENEKLYLLSENSEITGVGSYLFRVCGTTILQAPHSFFDLRTGNIALKSFLQNSDMRLLSVNTVHRYLQEDGITEERNVNPADACHNPSHPISLITDHILEAHDFKLIQIHGFTKGEGDPDIIVSSGENISSSFSESIFTKLKEIMNWHDVVHYNEGVDKLGGTTNVQGDCAQKHNRGFVHLELSSKIRTDLEGNAALQQNFSSCLKDS